MDEDRAVQEIVEEAEDMYGDLGQPLKFSHLKLLSDNPVFLARAGSELLGQGMLVVTAEEGAEIFGTLIEPGVRSRSQGIMALSH